MRRSHTRPQLPVCAHAGHMTTSHFMTIIVAYSSERLGWFFLFSFSFAVLLIDTGKNHHWDYFDSC